MSFEAVVLDANALITSGPTSLAGLSAHYVTVSEALAEVRDARARQTLSLLPFTIVTRIPSERSIEAVRAFARKTGDLARLSRTDLLLLALTHQLEVEANGEKFLRSEPPKLPTQAGLHKREMPACKFFCSPGGCRSGTECRFKHLTSAAVPENETKTPLPVGSTVECTATDVGSVDASVVEAEDSLRLMSLRTETAAFDVEVDHKIPERDFVAAKIDAGLPTMSGGMIGGVSGDAMRGGLQLASALLPAEMPARDIAAFTTDTLARVDAILVRDDDGDGEWISPSAPKALAAAPTVSDAVASEALVPPALARSSIVCVTSDFAMQNVLLQMGLQLASAQGKLVREVKTWVLKCDACFSITDKMDKLFCPTCGNATLARLGVSIAADGAPSYHYRKHRDFNTRGTVFALPTPSGGRNGGGLLLREDQLLTGKWAQKARERVPESSIFGDQDAALGSGDATSARRSAASSKHPDIEVGYGRRNPNAMRHRK